jgi:acyl carrier protein
VCDLEPKETIRQFILTKLISNSQNIEIDYETNLLKSGLIDSMALMSLVNFIENEFNLEISFTDFTIANFQSVNAINTYVQNKKS